MNMRVLSLIAIWGSALLTILLGGLPAASAERASIGSRAERVDASAYVEVDAGVLSLGQCPSGHFCVWGLPNYTGSFKAVTGTNVTHLLGGPVGSFWNNRSQASVLYTNTGASSTCYSAGVKKASVTVSYGAAQKVYLTPGSCAA